MENMRKTKIKKLLSELTSLLDDDAEVSTAEMGEKPEAEGDEEDDGTKMFSEDSTKNKSVKMSAIASKLKLKMKAK